MVAIRNAKDIIVLVAYAWIIQTCTAQKASVTTTGKTNPLWYILLAIGLFGMYKCFSYITRRVCGRCDNLSENVDIDEIYIELLTIEEENKQKEKDKAKADKAKNNLMKKRAGSILQHGKDESLQFLLENDHNRNSKTSSKHTSPFPNNQDQNHKKNDDSPLRTPSTVRSNQLHIDLLKTPEMKQDIENNQKESDEESEQDMWKLWNKHRQDDPNEGSVKVNKPTHISPNNFTPTTTANNNNPTSLKVNNQTRLVPLINQNNNNTNNNNNTSVKIRPRPPPLPLPRPNNNNNNNTSALAAAIDISHHQQKQQQGKTGSFYEISVPINPQTYTSNNSVSSMSTSSRLQQSVTWQANRETNQVGSDEHQADLRRAINKLHGTSTTNPTTNTANVVRRPKPPPGPAPRPAVSLPRPMTTTTPMTTPMMTTTATATTTNTIPPRPRPHSSNTTTMTMNATSTKQSNNNSSSNNTNNLVRRPAPPPTPPPRHILNRPIFDGNNQHNQQQNGVKNPLQQPLSSMMRPGASSMKKD